MVKKSFTEIQNEVISNYKVVIVENSTCRGRTHAHCDGTRRICKWNRANSVISTFTLLHEIGHIMTYKTTMRRCESEYFATIWALERAKEYGLEIPQKELKKYQDYIDRERQRGLNRHGEGYRDSYDLSNYDAGEIVELKIKEPKPVNVKCRRFVL